MTLLERQKEFVGIIKLHERLILKICALYSDKDHDDLRDLYQDAVCALWESYNTYHGDSKISTWIYSVTRFTMLNHIRKKHIDTTAYENVSAEYLQEDNNDKNITEELRSALALLPPEERDMIVMWLEGFDIDEIASFSGIKYGAAATKLTRIKMKLKQIMNPNGKELR